MRRSCLVSLVLLATACGSHSSNKKAETDTPVVPVIDQKPIEDDKKPIEEDKKPKPIEDDKKPIEDDKKPIEDDKKPIEDDKKPIEEDKKPIEEDKKPIEEDKKPIEEDKKPVDKTPDPVVIPTAPTTQLMKACLNPKALSPDETKALESLKNPWALSETCDDIAEVLLKETVDYKLASAVKAKQDIALKWLLEFFSQNKMLKAADLVSPLNEAIELDRQLAFESILNADPALSQQIPFRSQGSSDLLSSAIYKNRPNMVKLMLAYSLDINAPSYNCQPLVTAMNFGHRDIAAMLMADSRIEYGPIHSSCLTSWYGSAIRGGNREAILRLNAAGQIDVNQGTYETPLSVAMDKGDESLLKALLENPKLDVNKQVNESLPIVTAIADNKRNIVNLLLADPRLKIDAKEKSGRTALSVAMEKYQYDLIDQILDRADVTDEVLRAYIGYASQAPALLNAVGDPKMKESVIERLMNDPRVDRKQKSSAGRDLLFYAIRGGRDSIARDLLQDGYDVNTADKTGWTPLIFAIAAKREDLALSLIAMEGIQVNAREKEEGRTALHWAAYYGQTKVVEALLKKPGIEVFSKDWYSRTAKDLASTNRFPAIVTLLQDRKPRFDLSGAIESSVACIENYAPEFHSDFLQMKNSFFKEKPACDAAAFKAICVSSNVNQFGLPQRARITYTHTKSCLNSGEQSFSSKEEAVAFLKQSLGW